MPIVNLGILAHVDAGKTSLTERILYETGVIAAPGRVDTGTTQTDTLALERQRGISIQSAVASFQLGELKVNLIDTPGHTDFIAEVERALRVLDGVILVISAVEGVQSQTRKLAQAVRALGIPLILAVNKIDRAGARTDDLLADIGEKLDLRAVAMTVAADAGSRDARVRSRAFDGGDERLLNLLAEGSDQLLEIWLTTGGQVPPDAIRDELACQIRECRIVPVYYLSALHGLGVDLLLEGIAHHLRPAPEPADGPLQAMTFKVQRVPPGDKLVYLRLTGGRLAVRDHVTLHHREPDGTVTTADARVTAIDTFHDGHVAHAECAAAGDIVRVHGLKEAQTGDTIGREPPGADDHRFALPTLESVVGVKRRDQTPALFHALTQLAEHDPLITVRRHGNGEMISVRLYGEVQKEVIAATLEDDYGVQALFAPSRIIHIERPVGSGEAVVHMGESPFVATIGFRVEPGPIGSGLTYHRDLGSTLPSFYAAVEATVSETLREGLRGWQVEDIVVALTEVGYSAPVTVAADFRNLTPLVLMAALQRAGTAVLEPVQRFTLDVPAETVGDVLAALVVARGLPTETASHGQTCQVTGTIPAAEVHAFEQRLPGLSRGEGLFTVEFDHYEPVAGDPPIRPRTDFNPLNREEYLARLSRG
jgi:ribosomal protection tetracycline resistance protein